MKVGSHPLGGAGFNGDVWAHGDYAYVGTWGVFGRCPNNVGVKVIDVSDPVEPELIDVLTAPPGTRTSEAKVVSASTPFFDGDLLVSTNEACAFSGANGVQLWDVTDPGNAQLLGRFDTWPVHNAYPYTRGANAYVLLAAPNAEVFGASAGLPDSDLQIIDVTNPSQPQLIGEWTLGRDAGLAFGSPAYDSDPSAAAGGDCTPPPSTPNLCRGSSPAVFLHDVWTSYDGMTAYLSYWDAGLVTLDISDPSDPTLVAIATEPLSEEGNAHHALPEESSGLVLVSDEDFTPGPWGFLRVLDANDPANPVQVGTFMTPHSQVVPPPDDGWYSVHNAFVYGGLAYLAWYSDGVRVVDLTNPALPVEVASYVPPDVSDPRGYLPAKALVWGVYVRNDIAYASDMNGGLYVMAYDHDFDGCADLQEQRANPAQGGSRDPASFWDFFDTPDTTNKRDRAISAGDILRIVFRFGSTGNPAIDPLSAPPASGYHTAFDRTPPVPGGDPWDLGPPDGSISAGDILFVVRQFGHTCT